MSTRSIYVVNTDQDDTNYETEGDFATNLADFIAAKRGKNLSPRTVELYRTSNRTFLSFLKNHGHPTDVADLRPDHFRSFFIYRLQSVEPATVDLEFRHIRPFFNWLVKEGEIEMSPLGNVEPPKATRRDQPVISLDTKKRLLAACEGNTLKARRDLAMLRLWMETGIRKGEMHSILRDGLDIEEMSVVVTGKRGTRTVYFGHNTAEALRRYLRTRQKHRHANSSYLWLTNKGRMSYDGLRDMLEGRCKQAGVPPINPHRFRHTLRHDWGMAAGNDEDLKTQGDWTTDKMLGLYGASMKQQRAREAVQRLALGDKY